jgi:hypothetical protein
MRTNHFLIAALALGFICPLSGAADPEAVKRLDELLKAYKTYELPMPPVDAPLVRFPAGWRTVQEDGSEHEHHSLGFLLKPTKADGPTRVFTGTDGARELGEKERATVLQPTADALRDINANIDVTLAMQCHARGWTALAQKILLQEAEKQKASYESQLARAAWNYWIAEIRKPDSVRKTIARQIKLILKLHGKDFQDWEHTLLDSLELALIPGKGKAGTVEAQIDSLIDVTSTDRTDQFGFFNDPHPAYLRLAKLGFEAMPDLIEHMDDERLTRAYKQGFNNFRGYHYRIGDVVCDLLQGLAGEDVGKSWLRRLQGYRLDKKDVLQWWTKAQQVGEERYFVDHIFDGSKKNLQNRLMLCVIAHKYPKQLAPIYQQLLEDRADMYGWEIADAVAKSSLLQQTKKELFAKAAVNKSLTIRLDAVNHLRELDKENALKLLLKEVGNLPAIPDEEFWCCPESRVAHLVRNWNEPSAWDALEATAKRVDVGLRMEFIQDVGRRDVPEATCKSALRFLSKFLDDKEIRIANGPKYKGPYAGMYGSDRIEVRNFAAEQVAWVLKMKADPKPNWSDEQWSKLRDDVRKALAREGIR